MFDRLWSDGAVSFRIAPELKKRLVEALQPMIAATEEKLNAKGVTTKMADNRTDCASKEQPEVAKVLDEILADLGIHDLARVYWGKPISVPYLSLLINQAANMDKVFGASYVAWGIKPQKAVYYHVDSMLGCPLKMMLYISDVGMDNGPFQYVIGSARAADPMDLLIRKRGDKLKFSHRQIMALPKEFRRKSHFGFDLLDDMPATEGYLQNEKSFCSSEGDLVLFDANGIHRGGIVKNERRVALSLLLA